MPTLDWIGKNKVINHHQAVPYRVLGRRYSYDESGQHEADNGVVFLLQANRDNNAEFRFPVEHQGQGGPYRYLRGPLRYQ